MSSLGQDFLKIETYFLKVHINCEGCQNRVKKLLRKIEGVIDVKINIERQLVRVSGTVDPSTLINKLRKSGKHAELCFLTPGSLNQISVNGNIQLNNNTPRQRLIDSFQPLKHNIYTPEREENHDWDMQTYLNQNFGNEALTHHEIEPNYTNANVDEISAMMARTNFRVGGHGFTNVQDLSSPGYGFNHNDPRQTMNKMQHQGSHFNSYPPWISTWDYAQLSPMMMNSSQQAGYQQSHDNDLQMHHLPHYEFY
ncbi:hypothetical protein ACFE04_005879 [Oxalis oulophora]